jgi:CBS domain-containing protein
MKLAAVLAAKGDRVFTTASTTSVRDAVAELATNNIGALIVLGEDGRPVGILSERDIIRELSLRPDVLDSQVADLMSSPVVCGASTDDLDSVLRTMTSRRFRHMPVVDEGELVGMVTIADLVKAQLIEFRGAVDTLETRLMETST